MSAQGRSCSRPALFRGTNFSQWKNFNKDVCDWSRYRTLGHNNKGPKLSLKKDAQGNDVEKFESKYSRSDLESVFKNYRAMNQLCCSLNGTEFNKVSSCTSAKKTWGKLVVTYEGTN